MPDLSFTNPAETSEMEADESNFRRALRRTSWWLAILLGIPLLALLTVVALLLESARWVDRTNQIIARANGIEKSMVGMQTSFRGYRLSGDEQFLRPYLELHRVIPRELQALQRAVSDNPPQVAEVNAIMESMKEWHAFGDAELERVKEHPEDMSNPSFLKKGVPMFTKSIDQLERFIQRENSLREQRAAQLKVWIYAVFILFGLTAVIGILVVVTGMKRLLREVNEVHKTSRAEIELRANELHVTLSSIGDAVVAMNARGEVEFMNPVAEMMMGWTNDDARGRNISEVFDIVNEYTGLPAENPVERVLRENRVIGLANHTILRSKTGLEYPIEDSAAPIRDHDGVVLGVVLVFHDVSEKKVAERKILQSERRLSYLNTLSEQTRDLVSPSEIMTVTTRLLGQHLNASRCAYADVKPDGDHFSIRNDYTNDCPSSVGDYVLSGFGPMAEQCMRKGELLIINNIDTEMTAEEGADGFNAIGIKAIICCPLLREGRLKAMMAVHHAAPRMWTEEEISLTKEVVERSWATIERARTEIELQERAKLSELRADIAHALDSSGSSQQTLQRCCELIVTHLDAAFTRIWTLESATQMLILQASAGLSTELDGHQSRIPVGELKIGRIAKSQQPFLTNDAQHDPNISDHEWARREGLTAFAGYPLHVEGRLIGVLGAFARHSLSETILKDLAPIADAIAQNLERKLTEKALTTSETLKSAILNTSLDGFILMDHEGRVVDWNGAAETIFGVSKSEVLGQFLGSVIVPERLREMHQKGVERFVKTRESRILGRRYELPALRGDGNEFPCEISITHIPNSEPPLFAGYLRDISERKRAEEDLRKLTELAEANALAVAESAERFRLLAEVVSLQVWTAKLDGTLDYANQECIEYFGVSQESDILGVGWSKYVHPDDLPGASRSWQHCLTTGERYETEFRLLNKNHEYRWFLARAEAMTDGDNHIVKWFGTNTDIHELKIAQSNAELANRKKDAFLAALSHELRTPLTPVLMTAASLREDERLPTDVREQLAMMERNIALEARLIDDLLDLTSIARGKLLLRSQLFDTHSLIDQAIEIVMDDAQSKGIHLQKLYSATKCGLVVDPARFQQVIWNLLRNAVKFTPRNGCIGVTTHDEEGDALRIEVSDSGIGIESTELTQIFLPFEQGGLTGDHRFGGMGLGLSIARAIVELHGGTITARSSGANKGSTFIVILPNATHPPLGVGKDATLLPETSATGPTQGGNQIQAKALNLLMVEDHEPTLQVLSRLLQRAGHKVTTAGTVGDALEIAAKNKFDLVISDLGLPDGSGIDLMAALRDDHGLEGIALSGYGMEEDLARSKKAGFVAHLIKPIDFAQLKRALAQWNGG